MSTISLPKVAGLAAFAAVFVVCSTASERQAPPEEIQAGLHRNDPGAFAGYTLFGAQASPVLLIDNAGHMVHRWRMPEYSDPTASLLPNGHLMTILKGTGTACGLRFGGDVAWLGPDGEVTWRYAPGCVHHDHLLLPNGNVLLLANSIKSHEEVVAAGAAPAFVGPDGLVVDHLVEVRPEPPTGGEVVWRWSPWDHLVQDFDRDKPNYGRPRDHPGRVDLNFLLESLSAAGETDPAMRKDWLHANAIAYHAEANHVLFLARHFSELWVVDHSTTAEESAGRSGGRHGRGGEILWRWGNPRAHGAGTVADQRLFWPHDAHWIPAGLPGTGNILLFNNGDEFGDLRRDYSDVLELRYPLHDAKFGAWPAGEPHPPSAPTWRYVADPPGDFLSYRLGSAQRLGNGNTLIAAGYQGTIFEVTPEGREVWRYVSPVVSGMSDPLFEGDPVPYSFSTRVRAVSWRNKIYRARRYPVGHPGFAALDLVPKNVLAPRRIESYLAPDKLAFESEHYDVYVDAHWLFFANDDCHADDAAERLFAHATPVDASILPSNASYSAIAPPLRRKRQEDGRCIARWRVPEFPISHVLVGQRDNAKAMLWSGEIVLDRTAFEKTMENMLRAAGEPVIEAGVSGMDVHVHGQRIFYVSDDCQRADGRTPFFLHVTPVREADLPPERIEHGFDNLDFHQAGVAVGERCVVRWQLPDYPIRHIRTGQYVVVRDGEDVLLPRLWEGGADIGE